MSLLTNTQEDIKGFQSRLQTSQSRTRVEINFEEVR